MQIRNEKDQNDQIPRSWTKELKSEPESELGSDIELELKPDTEWL